MSLASVSTIERSIWPSYSRGDFLAAAAARTKRIRLTSAVTVLSSDDPVRVFQDFATLDLISQGRRGNHRGTRFVYRIVPAFWSRSGRLRHVVLRESPASAEVAREDRSSLVRQTPGRTYRPWRLPASGAKSAANSHRRGRNSAIARARRDARPSARARNHRWGSRTVIGTLVDLYREAWKRAGHAPDKLSIGVHNIGFIADETAQAADQHFPSYADAFSAIGRERGWGPVTRAQYDATRGPTGALVVGASEAVAEKIIYENEVLGGISRMTVLLNGGAMPHRQIMHAIELLGTKVALDCPEGNGRDQKNCAAGV